MWLGGVLGGIWWERVEFRGALKIRGGGHSGVWGLWKGLGGLGVLWESLGGGMGGELGGWDVWGGLWEGLGVF